MDYQNRILYWTDSSLLHIEMASLDCKVWKNFEKLDLNFQVSHYSAIWRDASRKFVEKFWSPWTAPTNRGQLLSKMVLFFGQIGPRIIRPGLSGLIRNSVLFLLKFFKQLITRYDFEDAIPIPASGTEIFILSWMENLQNEDISGTGDFLNAEDYHPRRLLSR